MITPKTKAVIAVHVGGRPSDLDALQAVADKHGIYLIGDAAQAVGAVWNGKGIGSYGIMSSFSLQNSKNLTSGEGGVITTNCDRLAEKIRGMLSFDTKYICADHNISEMQAAILCHQMELIPDHMAKRSENEAYLDSLLADIPYVSTLKHDERVTRNALHLYFIRIHEDKLCGVTRKEFLKELRENGVDITSGYVPLYDFACLKNNYTKKSIGREINLAPDTPVAEYIARHEASWLYQSMLLGEKEDMEFIADTIKNAYAKLCAAKEEK